MEAGVWLKNKIAPAQSRAGLRSTNSSIRSFDSRVESCRTTPRSSSKSSNKQRTPIACNSPISTRTGSAPRALYRRTTSGETI